MVAPLVSVCCITYNHKGYIRNALESFLMQKTGFPFEIIINDDASTDGTTDIIKEYKARYPELIFPVYHEENEYSKGIRGINARNTFPIARGKYIAMCEGDDYWTDPLKLQKQVDFMEANPEYCFSMGRVDMLMERTGKIERRSEYVNPDKKETYNVKDYLKHPFSQTSSFLFRNDSLNLPEWLFRVHAGDQSLVIVITGNKGKIKYHKDLFSIYRVHSNSITRTATYDVHEKFSETLDDWYLYLGRRYKFIFIMIKYRNIASGRLKRSNSLFYRVLGIINIRIVNFVLKLV